MILRKPYAFLVKHFRLIHAVLLMLIFFVFFQVYDILGFFNTYIGSPTSIYDFEIASKTLINFYSTFFAILVLGISGVLVYLLRYKKKPILLYVVIIIIYSIFIASFILLPSFVYGMGYNPPSPITNISKNIKRYISDIVSSSSSINDNDIRKSYRI